MIFAFITYASFFLMILLFWVMANRENFAKSKVTFRPFNYRRP